MSGITVTEVAQRLPGEEDILIMSHENPDGDALGCVSALAAMARELGVPYRTYIPGETAFPAEYSFLPDLDEVLRGPFPSAGARTTAYIMDCATAARLDPAGLRCVGECLNIDHHQDNPGFGTLNLLDLEATSTTQILFDIFTTGDLPLTPEIATSLYVGLVTDSGRFQYSNTTPRAHRMAAALQEAGVDVNVIYRRLYEATPLEKLLLLGRALDHLEIRLDGRLAVSWVDSHDFEATGADERHTEGIIDSLRRIRRVRVAAFVRERTGDDGPEQKVSLRSTDGSVNVAEVAHLQGGGGHVRAAGFTTSGDTDSVVTWIERQIEARL